MVSTIVGILAVLGPMALSVGLTAWSMEQSKKMAEEQMQRSEQFATEQYNISIAENKAAEERNKNYSEMLYSQQIQDSIDFNRQAERTYFTNRFGKPSDRSFK